MTSRSSIALALLLVSACFHYTPNQPTCPTGECPDGLTCIAGFCKGPGERGGCPGQDGQGMTASDRGAGGHGGGAVYLIAGSRIDIQGGINASGEGGAGGVGNASGAGGGGSGGMIAFNAPMITCTSLVLATGGGGGEGSDDGPNTPGDNGDDPFSTTAASGGIGNLRGGDGGAGSVATPTAGGQGLPGDNAGQSRGGGGAGGGGVGLIKASAAAQLGAQVAPPATP